MDNIRIEEINTLINEKNYFNEFDIDKLCIKILNIIDKEEQNKIIRLFLKETSEHIIKNNKTFTTNEIKEIINIINKNFSIFNDTNEILKELNFNIETITEEIEEFNKNSNYLNNNNENINSEDSILTENETSLNAPEKKKNKVLLNNLNRKVEEIKNFLNEKKSNEEIEEEVNQLVSEEEIEEEVNQLEDEKEIKKIEKMIEELQNKKKNYSSNNYDINSKYDNLSLDELEKKLNITEEQKQDLIHYSMHMANGEENNDIEKIENEITLLKKVIKKKKINDEYKDFSNSELINIIERYNAKKETNESKKNSLNEELNKLTNQRNDLWQQQVQIENGEIEDNQLEVINKRINEIKKELEELKNDKFYITIKKNINIDKEKQKELMEEIVYCKEYKQILQSRLNKAIINNFDKNAIEMLNIEISNNNNKLNEKEKELNNLLFNNKEEKNIEINNINEIKELLNERTLKKFENISNEDLYLRKNEINEKILDLIHYGTHIENGEINNSNEHNIIINLQHELKEIDNELNRRNNINYLTDEEKDLLNNLIEIKNSYYKIINDTIVEFENKTEEEKTTENIKNFINEHKLIEVINHYEKSEKLKKELIEDVLKKLNIKNNNKINKKENNKKIWLKALAAVGGFATGLGVSCIPGIGTITMGISVAKLTANATKSTINFFAKRNPEGKCAKIKNFSEKQFNNFTGKLENKYPGITDKIKNMKAKLKESPLNCFINGLAAGYITGNFIEMFTGESLLENAKDLFNNNSNSIPQITPEGITAEPITESIIESNTSNLLAPPVTNIDPSGLNGIDLSSVSHGFASSYSDKPINLFTELAKNLSFDKANIVNGEEFWHFIQPDGTGYAWFKADDVRHLVEAATKTAGKTM